MEHPLGAGGVVTRRHVGDGRHGSSVAGSAPSCWMNLQKQYVTTARAKGVGEGRLLIRYPAPRMALNPSHRRYRQPAAAGQSPDRSSSPRGQRRRRRRPGPMPLSALQSQTRYLAGSFLMFLAVLTVVGMLISDILLAVSRPAHPALPGGAAR